MFAETYACFQRCSQRAGRSGNHLYMLLHVCIVSVSCPSPSLSFSLPPSLSTALHNLYSSKITLEYQLPTSSQKLTTTNECIVSILSGLTLTALKVPDTCTPLLYTHDIVMTVMYNVVCVYLCYADLRTCMYIVFMPLSTCSCTRNDVYISTCMTVEAL